MKNIRPALASLVTLFAACCLHAAHSTPVARVISILEIQTEDPAAYTAWIKQYNDAAKAKLNVDNYLRVFETRFDGRATGRLRVVSSAASVAELSKNASEMENDPVMVQNRERLQKLRKMGGRVLYQALRFDGPSPKGAHNYNTLAMVTDEAGYLKAVDQLRTLFDANGLKEAKISVYRVLAGRTDHTHRITISTPSAERLGSFLDLMAGNAQMNEWVASSAKYRTVVSNTTSREITK